MMYSNVVLQLDHHLFQDVVDNKQQKSGAKA